MLATLLSARILNSGGGGWLSIGAYLAPRCEWCVYCDGAWSVFFCVVVRLVESVQGGAEDRGACMVLSTSGLLIKRRG